MQRSRFALGSACLATALACAPASAATYLVTRFDDPLPNGCLPRDCSLREAAMAADATGAADTIQLGAGTYNLTRADPFDSPWVQDLDFSQEDVTIQGEGSRVTRIRNVAPVSLHSDGRVIEAFQGRLTLKGLRLEDGDQPLNSIEPRGGCLYAVWMFEVVLNDVIVRNCEVAGDGGGILIGADQATFTDVTVELSHATRGGGVWLVEGVHQWTRVVVRDNDADDAGGGLLFSNGDSVTMYLDAATRISGNTANRGGAIAIIANPITVGDVMELHGDSAGEGLLTRISGNVASTGGAIHLSDGATLVIDRVAITENRAARGAGIDTSLSKIVVSDAELTGNIASGDGGGIAFHYGMHDLRRVSLAANEAGGRGGGMYGIVENVLLENISFAGNVAASGGGMDLVPKPGAVRIKNNSFGGNVALSGDGSDGARVAGKFEAASSWFGDGCATPLAVSWGGNAQATGTPNCGLGASDVGYVMPAAALVSYGDFGGPFDILGFAAGSALTNAAYPAPCAPNDARGVARSDGRCDVGAYEAPP